MEIKLFILGLFVVTFVKADRDNEGKIGLHYNDRRRDESHISVTANNADLEDSLPSEDEARFRFKRQHFRHDPEWHRRHGVDMPNERNDTDNSNNGHRHHPFTHNREWHERRGIPMPGDNKSHHHRHRRPPHRHPNHRHFSTTLPTTTVSPTTLPTSCEIDVTAPTPTVTPIWEIINPRGLTEGINIDFTTSISTTTRPTTTRPTIARTTTTRPTATSPTTTDASREIYDVRRQDDQDETEWINMP